MMRQDDFDYAIENTQVIVAPERQIATFGSTSFNFYLISELMDRVDQVRVRNGKIHAERPQILTPEHYCRLLLEGFGEKAQRYVDQLREHARNVAVLRYGFQFRKTDVTEHTLRDSIEAVINRTKRRVETENEALSAVIQGVDDAWEVCLLKFTIDMIERSSGGNIGDFRQRGLL
jgi:phenylalanyl-tRNA synthetase beta subunit